MYFFQRHVLQEAFQIDIAQCVCKWEKMHNCISRVHKIEEEGAIELGTEIRGNTFMGHVFRGFHKLHLHHESE